MSDATQQPSLVRGRVVTTTGVLDDGYVLVDGDRIGEVGPVSAYAGTVPLPPTVDTVLPGLVDIHCHGGGGATVTSGEEDQVRAAARHHRGAGTTSVVASTVTDSPERMLATVAAAARAAADGEVAAIHLEGPFLSRAQCGAQDPRHLCDPDLGLARELVDAGDGHVRVMTLAPELPGATGLAELLRSLGVVPAVGHTQADYRITRAALGEGPRSLVTHLFNGMPPMHHRSPGPVAASLQAAARGDAAVELVADGVHLADGTVGAVFDLLGASAVVLVTDAMAAAGMPDGDYRLGPQDVTVAGGVARLTGPGEQSIAGGTARLLDVVRRCVQHAGVALPDAVTAASSTPASVIGAAHEVGALAPGLRADLLVVDDDLALHRVMRAGRWLE
jgi:N-acetylglucosamine-6-phosphate deacetylase